ncbi:MAG TPA: site-specific integrase [Nocardioides sp.]|nr:site-specific integrase [Nocardioides sp.]
MRRHRRVGPSKVWASSGAHPRPTSTREVPIPRFRAAELAEHVRGKRPDDLVFSGIRNGQPLRVSTFRTAFGAAAMAIGVPDLHLHQLRHTAASVAIASGADVKVVQQMLGHSSATITLDNTGISSRTGSTRSAARWTPPPKRREPGERLRAFARCCPGVARDPFESKRRSGPGQRCRWSGPPFGVVPPTGFEPALPP